MNLMESIKKIVSFITRSSRLTLVIIFFLSSNKFLQGQGTQEEIKTIPYLERISLFANSSYFLVGESILFSAQCIDVSTNELSNVSKILYIELIDENADVVLKTKTSL